MCTIHNDPGTGSPRPRTPASGVPAVLTSVVAALLLLSVAPHGHAQTDLEPVLGAVDDQIFLKDQAVDIDRTTTAAEPVVLPQATGGDGTLTYTLECAASETSCDATTKLPPGLAFSAASRELSGTPTTSGTWDMVYTVTDADTTDPDSDSVTFEIKVLDDPVLSINAPEVTEGDSGSVHLSFTVTLSPVSGEAVTVKFADAGTGTATSGTDYTAFTGGTLSFVPGASQSGFTVSVKGDIVHESDETVVITLSDPSNAEFAGGDTTITGTGTITNDDDPVLSIDDPEVTEGDSGTTTLTWTVTLSAASSETVTVKYADAGTGTATSSGTGADYTAPTAGTLTFNPGQTSKTIGATVNGDTTDEPDETVVIKLSDLMNAEFAGGGTELTGTGTIENDDDPVLSISPSTVVAEGDSGTVLLTWLVELSAASSETVTVKYADAGTGTATSGDDYDAITAGTLSFTPGDTLRFIQVTVNGDTDDEPDETIDITLSEPTHAAFAGGATTGTGTIENDDDPVLTIDAPSVVEGGGGDTATLTFTVTLSPASGDTITVNYADAGTSGGGTATSGTDYDAITAGTLTFAPNETEKTIEVTVKGDTADESHETVVIELSGPSNAQFAGGGTELTGTGTIENDDDPVLTIDAPSVAEGGDDETATLTFTVTMTPASADTITVAYKDAGTDGGGTATSGDDYDAITAGTLTFGPSVTSRTIEVTVNGDTTDEANETVVIELSSPTNAQFADGAATASGTGTIGNDDDPVVTIDDPWVAEGDSGTTTLTFNVRLSGASHETATVVVSDAGTGTATSSGADADYAWTTTGILNFASGVTHRAILVTVNGDTTDELDETVVFTIDQLYHAVFPDGATELSGTGTIRNDDKLFEISVEGREEGDDGTTTLTFTVNLSGPAGAAGVKVSYRDVTASAGVSAPATSGENGDYTAISDGQLVFASGEQSKTIEVTVNADRDDESDEQIVLEFHSPENALFAGDAISERVTATILNDDGTSQLARTVSINSPSVDEGDDGTTTLTFTVVRSGGTQSVVTVNYADTGVGNATPGEDYEAISAGTLTFESGETSKIIEVTVNGDTTTELNETVVITLSNPVNAALPEDPSGTGTIINDDGAVLTIEGSSVDEGDGADGEDPAQLEFTLRLSGPVSHEVTVDFADTGRGTATAGDDYVAFAPDAVTFQSGQTGKVIGVLVLGDTRVEHHETVVITFSNPVGAGFLDGATELTVTGTIHSDDGIPPPPGSTPVADAGADFEVDPEAPVTLDGSGSSDPEGEALTFAWSPPAAGVEVTLAGADTAAPSFTAPWQPGGLVFGLTVTDPDGLSASDEVTVAVRDLAPGFGSAAVSSPALVVNEAMEAVVLPEANGGNGALTYSLTSVPAGLAGLSFDPATRRLSGTPTEEKTYVFTYRAHDADANQAASDAAVLTFGVTVEDPRTALLRQTMKRTLAAVARRALSSALENIGARFASSIPDSGLTLAGTTLRLGAAKAPDMVGASDLGGAAGRCSAWPHRHGFRAGTDGCPSVGTENPDVKVDELLRTSAFSLTLGAAEGSGGSSVPLWAVWGRGDLGSFAGRPEPGMRYDGELRTGWLGIDARAGPWVAGLAFSHGKGEADYGFDQDGLSGQGRLETTLNAFYPYGRWTIDEGLELRAVLGAGTGEARHVLDEEEAETSDLAMRMASVGVRRELPAVGEFDLAVRADASIAQLETDSGPQFIDNLSADTWRGRVGLEASRRFVLSEDAALTPFVEAAGRGDGGDGLTGAGIELAGGVRYRAPGLEVEARGRWLAAHVEAGARERGVSVTARVGPGAHGRGLSLLVAPRWGAETGRADALWSEEMPRLSGGTGNDAASLDARMGYGLALAPQGLLTPFAETALTGGERRRLRLGTRFDATGADLGVELAGERRESAVAAPEHALTLDVIVRF